jgi:hypothetical protein
VEGVEVDKKSSALSDVQKTLQGYLLSFDSDPLLEVGANSVWTRKLLEDMESCLTILRAIATGFTFQTGSSAVQVQVSSTAVNSLEIQVAYLQQVLRLRHGSSKYTQQARQQLEASLLAIEALRQLESPPDPQPSPTPLQPPPSPETGEAHAATPAREKQPPKAELLHSPELRKILSGHFSKTTLRALAHDLDINPEELSDQKLTDMALSLIQEAEHRGQYEALVNKVRDLRPHLFPEE